MIFGKKERKKEEGPAKPSQWAVHVLVVFWKLLFAIVPPVNLGGGWPAFGVSLGFIALCAGHKLHIHDLRAHLKSVVLIVVSLSVFEYAIGCATVYSLAPWIGFMKKLKRPQILAIAFMVSARV